MQLFSRNKTDYSKLVLLMGRYFQIRDDYCNLKQQEVFMCCTIFIYSVFKENRGKSCVAHELKCKCDKLWVRFLLERMKYLIFSFTRH